MPLSRNVVLGVSTAVLVLTSVGLSSFSLFLPPIEAEFGRSRATATIPYAVAMLSWGMGAVLFGKLADEFGPRRVILGGIVLMAAGFTGMGLAQTLWQLSLSFGLLVGLALGACGLSMVSLLISRHFNTGRRGLAVSVVQIASPLNPVIFAPLLFFLITTFGWRAAALVLAGLLVGLALPLAWLGAQDPGTSGSMRRARIGWGPGLSCLRHPPIIVLFLGRFACGLAFFQIAHLFAIALSKGFSAAAGATALSAFGASAAGWALLFGWLADRHGRARMLALSYMVRGVGTIALAFPIPNELWFYLLMVVGVGPTFASVAVNSVMVYESVGPRLAGLVLGLSFIVHQIGSAGGPLIGSFVYDSTGTYDGFLLVMGLILFASGALTCTLTDAGARLPEAAAARARAPAPLPGEGR